MKNYRIWRISPSSSLIILESMSSPDVSGSIPGLFVQCISLYQNDEENQLFLLETFNSFSLFLSPVIHFSCSVMSDSLWPHGLQRHAVLLYLLEFAQTQVHQVSVAILPSHPLLPSPPAFNISQHQGLFQWVLSSHQVATVLDFSFSISTSNGILFLYLLKSYSRGQIWR